MLTYLPLYLTRIEGPPPKRNVVRSSRARGARIIAAFVHRAKAAIAMYEKLPQEIPAAVFVFF